MIPQAWKKAALALVSPNIGINGYIQLKEGF
jgi:hypothetical protein